MKSKITDLRNHLFAALERLSEEGITPDQLKKEIARAQSISDIGKVIVDSVKIEVMYARVANRLDLSPTDFLEIKAVEQIKGIERPAAQYSNPVYNN